MCMQTKEHGFEAKAASEFARLRKFQADLEEETGNACFVGLSVVGTAQQCVRLGNARAANRVQSEFRLSERRFWWLKVELIFNSPPPPKSPSAASVLHNMFYHWSTFEAARVTTAHFC